jgi:hypothetical protein
MAKLERLGRLEKAVLVESFDSAHATTFSTCRDPGFRHGHTAVLREQRANALLEREPVERRERVVLLARLEPRERSKWLAGDLDGEGQHRASDY